MVTRDHYWQFQRHRHYISDIFLDLRNSLDIFAKCKSEIVHSHYKAVIVDKAPFEVDAIFLDRLSDIVLHTKLYLLKSL